MKANESVEQVPQRTGVVVVYVIHEKTAKQPRHVQNMRGMCAMIIAPNPSSVRTVRMSNID